MDRYHQCISLIQKIRDIAYGNEVAYVARSRIGRLVMAIIKLVGDLSDITLPPRPQPILLTSSVSIELRELVQLYNELFNTSRVLVQPSEPLDERWKTGWNELMLTLNHLEKYLKKMQNRPLTIVST